MSFTRLMSRPLDCAQGRITDYLNGHDRDEFRGSRLFHPYVYID
jgi:hypothetical protein